MMRKRQILKVFILILVFCFGSVNLARSFQEYSIDLSASTQYTDNLYLTPTDKAEDYLSLFGFNFSTLRSEKTHSLNFNYAFNRAQYWRYPENNTNRQNFSLGYQQNLSPKLALNFSSSYNFSEEPIERNREVFRERTGKRSTYYRFGASAGLSYNFAPQSFLSLGANLNYLQNKDPDIEDSRIYAEFIKFTRSFTRFFMGFGFKGTQREMETTPQVNTWGYDLTTGYHLAHNKNISATFSAERTQDYALGSNDYWVYNFSVSYTYQPTKDQQWSFSLGYYKRDSDGEKGSNNGWTYSLNYGKRFRRTSFSVNGSGGYRYEYGEAENPGFTKYYMLSSSISRELSRTLSASVTGMYRHEDFVDESRMDDTYGFSAGLHKQVFKKLSLSAEYSYRKRSPSGKNPEEGYEENVVNVSLTYQFWRGRSLW